MCNKILSQRERKTEGRLGVGGHHRKEKFTTSSLPDPIM